ncbi:DISARM system phospholipase D-like protein DrmC [Limimaricola sp. G21655-S1]|uniref:DISARM system phospholipase D-like protein DrmC n=1 Tax=Limimaricola sp. G21655-S1 TaxID=3014768 RepID=UPI0022AFA1A4|nr:DISARM system phospholipase D-like protein DrmC [Limimaricola sp. G21655-S1]
MKELLEVIADIATNTPQGKVEQLGSLITKSSGPLDAVTFDVWTTAPESRSRLKRLIDAWKVLPELSPVELSAMLRAASYVHNKVSNEQSIELVWTGPSSAMVPTRKTEQALLQVINAAQDRLFVTSFVTYKVGSIVDALNKSTARGVNVSILLERSEADGGGVSNDGIGAMKKSVPNAKLYYWANRVDAFSGGKVHAKVAVADENLCFISSANLTGHAMEKNMEAGVLIDGGTTPQKLQRHLEALVTTKQLSRA